MSSCNSLSVTLRYGYVKLNFLISGWFECISQHPQLHNTGVTFLVRLDAYPKTIVKSEQQEETCPNTF